MKSQFSRLSSHCDKGMGMRKTSWLRWLAFLLVVMTLAYLYVCFPGAQSFIAQAIDSAYDPSKLKQLILSYRPAAPLIILMLTVLQAIITILPLCFVMMASTMALGFFRGVVVSIVSQVIAGYLTMRLTRYFGHSVAVRFETSGKLLSMSNFIKGYGKWGVLMARLLPFGSFDLVNFASGLLNVKDQDFIFGTVFGVIPATCFYGLIGAELFSPGEAGLAVYYGLCSVIVLSVIFSLWVRRNT